MGIKKAIKQLLPRPVLEDIRDRRSRIEEHLLIGSIQRAMREQGLAELYGSLSKSVPDLSRQYTGYTVEGTYLNMKIRAQHAFQILMVSEALAFLDNIEGKNRPFTVVDVGDSAGTHIKYIKDFFSGQIDRCLSVNIDIHAVERIRNKGLEAICARAEELTDLSIDADIFLSFQMLEHLMDPCRFLHNLSEKTNCKALVVTVPYLVNSRVAGQHLRNDPKEDVFPERMHIFELSPDDWRALFKHSGWRVEKERIYRQYPLRWWSTSLLRRLWKRLDYEGFYGAILVKDTSWSRSYKGWPSD